MFQAGLSPLQIAVESRRVDIEDVVAILVEDGQAALDVTSLEDDATALHYVIKSWDTPDVECLSFLLLSLGADKDIRDAVSLKPNM